MAVARMQKVTLIGHAPMMDRTIALLQGAGVMDVTVTLAEDESAPEGYSPMRLARDDERLRRLEEYLADAEFVASFLGRYHTMEAPFSAFISEKIHLRVDEFLALEPDDAFLDLYRETESMADELARGARERERLERLLEELEPWVGLRLEVERWQGTEHVALFTGTVPAARSETIRQMLRDAVPNVTVNEVGPAASRQAWVVMAHVSCLEQVRAVLALTDFMEVSFPGLHDYPAEEAAIARDRITEIDERRAELAAHAKELAYNHYHSAAALAEALHSRLEALMVRERFAVTERTFVITGWVRSSQRERLLEEIAPLEDSVDVAFEDPGPEDHPPIELENPRILKPFEVLTDLYGRPQYNEVDPTPLLAPFFFLFFGLCISDVGYGLMLIVGAYLIKTKLDVAPGVRKFMDLIMLGGLSAMIIGVLFGSWLAIDLNALSPSFEWFGTFARTFQVLSPLEQIQEFLLFTVALGVIQVFFGVIIAAWDAFRRGDAASAISQQISTMFLFAMIAVAVLVPGAGRWAIVVGLGVTMLLQGRSLAVVRHTEDVASWDRWLGFGWLAILVGFIASLAFGAPAFAPWVFAGFTVAGLVVSKTVRRSVISLLGGAYAVYGMTSFLGDVLSYTRLAALGLSGALVGSVMNLLGGLLWSVSGNIVVVAIGILGGIAVLLIGHVFNVVINLLGAFVHPARLQYVEFFSKFYEGGGQLFDPFRYRTKSLVLSAGESRREGGAKS